jgi:hypothetical protein
MSLLTIIIVFIVAGFLLWLVNSFIPMQRTIKMIINIIIVAFLLYWLVKVTGILALLGAVKI